jgi:putative hydrolase of the HAD superfamily
MTLEAIFFDVGRTLLIEEPSRYEIYAEVARARGRNLTEKTMARVMHRAHDDVPARIGGAYRYSDVWFRAFIHRIFCQNLGLPAASVAEITEELFARFTDPATFRVFPGARELLAELSARGLKLGVISNWSERLRTVLERVELAAFFDVVICSAIEKLEKPDPAIFRLALERAGAEAGRTLHLGDHPVKDGGARAVGMGYVRVDHRGAVEPDSDPETPVVRSFEELRTLLDSRLAG